MTILLMFLFVMIVTAVLFGGWVIMTIFHFIARVVTGTAKPSLSAGNARCCANPGCRTINPMHAQFCRRCGSNLRQKMSNEEFRNQSTMRVA